MSNQSFTKYTTNGYDTDISTRGSSLIWIIPRAGVDPENSMSATFFLTELTIRVG